MVDPEWKVDPKSLVWKLYLLESILDSSIGGFT